MALSFNITNAKVLDPQSALAILASRGEWSRLAEAVSPLLAVAVAGSAITFESLGLTEKDFARTVATKNAKVGDTDYSGIRAAIRTHGYGIRGTTDGFMAFYRPTDAHVAQTLAKVKASREKAAAKAKEKAK